MGVRPELLSSFHFNEYSFWFFLELPDETLDLLSRSTPEFLEAFDNLVSSYALFVLVQTFEIVIEHIQVHVAIMRSRLTTDIQYKREQRASDWSEPSSAPATEPELPAGRTAPHHRQRDHEKRRQPAVRGDRKWGRTLHAAALSQCTRIVAACKVLDRFYRLIISSTTFSL